MGLLQEGVGGVDAREMDVILFVNPFDTQDSGFTQGGRSLIIAVLAESRGEQNPGVGIALRTHWLMHAQASNRQTTLFPNGTGEGNDLDQRRFGW